ncbi:hypothetical protein GCM10023310_13790 [Paenibacillus vulneris]|uniref:Cohesin domain-containing protein n=1 Tax=Paenibacillus vulneris TaxID=1133364 RepID=A0ABW3ULF9_9BACL
MRTLVSAFVLSFFLFLLVPISSVSAMEGGLLDRKPLNVGLSINDPIIKTTNKLTDRDLVQVDSIGKTNMVWYEFSSIHQITGYFYQSWATGTTFYFYDSNKNLLSKIDNLPTKGNSNANFTSIAPVDNVKYVAWKNTGTTTYEPYELDVTGTATPTPQAPTLTGALLNNQSLLTWTESANATGYNVKKATQSGGPYNVVANNVTGTTYFVDTNVTPGLTYYYVVTAANQGGESTNSNEISVTPLALEPSLNVLIPEEKVKIGQEITANIELKNVNNIYAEDFTIKYDRTVFDYVGFEEISGYKVYNQPTDQNGTLRFIVASQGQGYGINDEKVFLKLKLRAKAAGTGKVDATKCRIADTEKEFDLQEANCGEDSLTIEGVKDVNRSGEYTLLDLAIDAYYYGQLASNADPSKYDADQAGDEYVNDDDLVFIVNQILNNSNYPLNS